MSGARNEQVEQGGSHGIHAMTDFEIHLER